MARRLCQPRRQDRPSRRRALTELYAGQGWPADDEELPQQSLGPRGPELLLEAPGWLGLAAGQLVLDAGCRDATYAIAMARRYGCRVLGIDLVSAWLPKGQADAAAAGFQVVRRERIASEWSVCQLEHDPGYLTQGRPTRRARPQHILAVHRCLHRALAQAVTWRLLARNVAIDAAPPPRPHRKVVALAPEQVALLLDAADRAPSPWLGPWTVLAAATGARNGELCGLDWSSVRLGDLIPG